MKVLGYGGKYEYYYVNRYYVLILIICDSGI